MSSSRAQAKEKASAHIDQAERNRRARERLLHDDEAREARISGATVADGYDLSKLDQKAVSQALQGDLWNHEDQARYDKAMGISPKPEEPKPEQPKPDEPKPEPKPDGPGPKPEPDPDKSFPTPPAPGPGDGGGSPGVPGWGWGASARGGDAYNLNYSDNDVTTTGDNNTVEVDNSVSQQSYGGNASAGSYGNYGQNYLRKYLGRY